MADDETQPDLQALGERIEGLLGELAGADPRLAERAERAVALVTQFHGVALDRLLELLDEATVGRLADDGLVAGMLIVHGLHPVPVEERVAQALDSVRPYLGSHGGDVELVGVDDAEGVVRLRMLGSCDGCPSSAVTLQLAVEGAVNAAAPEIDRIDVEGAEPAAPAGVDSPVQLTRKPDTDESRWTAAPDVPALGPGTQAVVEVGREAVLVCRVDQELYAYRDTCPSCAGPLAGGSLDGVVLRCGTCGAAFDVLRAGRGLDGPALHLDPRPLLHDEGGDVRIAVPAGAS